MQRQKEKMSPEMPVAEQGLQLESVYFPPAVLWATSYFARIPLEIELLESLWKGVHS